MRMIDSPRKMATQLRDPRSALASGELQADNVLALERFDRAFRFDPEALDRARRRFHSDTGHDAVKVSQGTQFVFGYLLEEAFVGGSSQAENLHFSVIGAGEYSVAFQGDTLEVHEGRVGESTGRIVTSRDTFNGMTLFKVMSTSTAAESVRLGLSATGRELHDYELASVAGGKGSDPACWSDYGCGGDILVCGGDSNNCGGDILVVGCREDYNYCAGDLCGSDLGCDYNACALDACYAAGGCDVAACVADGCGADGCRADGCVEAACGAAACSYAACHTEACGADACLADACLVAGCVVDVPPVDGCVVDGCLINVLPVVPLV